MNLQTTRDVNVKLNTQAIKDELITEADAIRRKTRKDYKCIRSRGTHLCTGNEADGQVGPNVAAECHGWNGTAKEIYELVDKVLAGYPDVEEIYIERGYDGANSPRGFNDFEYDPWVDCITINVWTRKDGFNKDYVK